MKICIYKIINPKGKIYVGKTKNYEQRLGYYKRLQCSQQRKIYNSLKKYGPENHIFEIIEECLYEELNEKEIYWINELKSVENGLNLSYGGDGGNLSKESEELRRVNSMKPILQYDLEGNFIKEWRGGSEAIESIGFGNANNINDCARGKYYQTYGFRWKYKKDIEDVNQKLPSIIEKEKGALWTEERRIKTKNSRIGETRSEEYKNKISILKKKKIYQFDIKDHLIKIFPSFESVNGSKIIGQTKLMKIINKPISYNGFYYSHNNYPVIIKEHTIDEMIPKYNFTLFINDIKIVEVNKSKKLTPYISNYIIYKCLKSVNGKYNKYKIIKTKL